MKIYKYELEVTDKQTLQLPQLSKILSIQVQDDNIMLWALVNDKCILRQDNRFIECYGTGHEIDDVSELTFLATIQYSFGVWHFFERDIEL